MLVLPAGNVFYCELAAGSILVVLAITVVVNELFCSAEKGLQRLKRKREPKVKTWGSLYLLPLTRISARE